MAVLSKQAKKMAEALGVDPDSIRQNLAASSRLAATEVQTVLQRMLNDLISTSESGALRGYRAILVEADTPAIRLHVYGEVFKGFEWVVFVEAPPWHQEIDLNVFDLLDQGRPQLPKDGTLYPLWGETEPGTARIPSGGGRAGGRFSVAAQIDKLGAIRKEPRFAGQKPPDSASRSLRISQGPIRAVAPKDLYRRAFKIAKRRISNLVGKDVWQLIYVPNRERWIA